jgi:outer membrane cobalamin receptor
VDEFGFTSNFYLFPAAKAELQVIPKYVRLFIEAKGDVNKTSIRDLSTLNPFIGQNIAIKNSVDKLDVSAGLKGTLAPALSFKADIYRNSIRNMPLFISNFNGTGNNKFAVVYDGGSSRVNGFNGELDFKPSDDLNIFGRVEFKDYQMATEAQAWNLPKFKLTAGTSIRITDKVNITGTLLIRGATYSRDVNFTIPQVNIKSFADLSGGVEYKVNSRVFIFGKVNNILNTNNQTWLYYPDYGFNIFGGAGLSF